MLRTLATTATIASAMFAAPLALAAPAQNDDVVATPSGSPDGPSNRTAPAPVTATGSGKSVDLLLQLQDKPQLYDRGPEAPVAGANRRTGDAAPRKEEAATATPLPSSLSDLKKSVVSGQTPATAEAPRSEHPSEGDRRADGSAPSGPMPLAAMPAQDGEPASRLSSHPLIRFIRENRGLTVLVVAGLAVAVWLTATVSIRRGR